VWCYGLSSYAGKVTLRSADNVCTAACNNFYANISVGSWY
jgi:hypothetical protein